MANVAVTLNSATLNGQANVESSDHVTLKFSADIPALAYTNITFSNANITRLDDLRRTATGTYDLYFKPSSTSWAQGNTTNVTVSNPTGYTITTPTKTGLTLHKIAASLISPYVFAMQVTVAANGTFTVPTSNLVCEGYDEINDGGFQCDWGDIRNSYSWEINWGDGGANTKARGEANSTNLGIPHKYTNAGTYLVKIVSQVDGTTPYITEKAGWFRSFGFSEDHYYHNYDEEISYDEKDSKNQANKNKVVKILTPLYPQMTRLPGESFLEQSDGLFSNCRNLQMGSDFTFAETAWKNIAVGGDGFGAGMFAGCSGANFTMNAIFNLPQTATSIYSILGENMFYRCSGAKFTMNSVFNLPPNIVINSNSYKFGAVGSSMFQGCSGANFTMNKVFNLPQKITHANSYFATSMFQGCSGASFTMNSVFNLPQKITFVESEFAYAMFQGCSGASFTMNKVFNLPQDFSIVNEFTWEVSTNFASSMFQNAGGSNFQVNTVFKFPAFSNERLKGYSEFEYVCDDEYVDGEYNGYVCEDVPIIDDSSNFFSYALALSNSVAIQNRAALSIIGDNKVDPDTFSRNTFNAKFQDLSVIQKYFNGTTSSELNTKREVYYELNDPNIAVVGTVAHTIFTQGDSVTLTPNSAKLSKASYEFKEWNTEPNGTGTAYADGAIVGELDDNLPLYAQWWQPFVVNATVVGGAEGHGAISPAGDVLVGTGDSQEFTFTPDTGYHILEVKVDGAPVTLTTDNTYTLESVVSTRAISVKFAINTYTITPFLHEGSGDFGTISPNTPQTVNYGDTPTFTITPNEGYRTIVYVDGEGGVADNNSSCSYTFPPITESHTITVQFTPYIYVVSPLVVGGSSGHGGISPSGQQGIKYGETTTFTFTPANHYHVAQVKVDGEPVTLTTDNSYTLPPVKPVSSFEHHTISVEFAIDTFVVTPSVVGGTEGHGTISPNSPQTMEYGKIAVFHFMPDDNYHIAQVKVDGEPVQLTGDTYYVFPQGITASHEISVEFAIDTYPITPSVVGGAEGHGTISPGTEDNIDYGDTPTFEFNPETGYHVAQVKVDGEPVELAEENSYTFTPITTSHSIRVEFAINIYTITPTVVGGTEGHGTISPDIEQNVNHGDTLPAFTFNSAPSYHVAQVKVDGEPVELAEDGSYTFGVITASHEISVEFAIDTWIITPSVIAEEGNSLSHGKISPDIGQVVHYGDTLTFTFTPDNGYRIKQVLVDGVPTNLTAPDSYTFDSIVVGNTIAVEFEIIPTLGELNLVQNGRDIKATWGATVPFSNYQLTLKNAVADEECVYKNETGKDLASSCVLFTPTDGSNSYVAKGLFAGTYIAILTAVHGEQAYSVVSKTPLKLPLAEIKGVTFKDTSKLTANSKTAINWMSQYGVTQGKPGGKYDPSGNVTRNEMALFLYRLAGKPIITKTIPMFEDVDVLSADSQNAIKWLASTGITIGTKSRIVNGVTYYWYSPKDNVTRGQMALFMHRLAGVDADTGTTKVKLSDVPKEGEMKVAIEWLASWAITVGAKGKYDIPASVTREHMALFMQRLASTLKSY
jgi:hypothetical protein